MRRFFDTNVLVYSRDRDAAKRAVARALIDAAIEDDAFVVSTQVLVEFYSTALRRRLLGPAEALELVRFWGGHDAVAHTPELVTRGLELHLAHSLSPWDGQIVQAALDAGCEVLFSEDLQHGRRFGELEIANPFLAPPGPHETPALSYRRSRRSGPGPSRQKPRPGRRT